MYKLGVVGSLLLLACTRSLDGGDVQIGCWLGVYCGWLVHALWREGMYRLGVGWESIVGGLYTLFGRWGCTDRVWVC